ncbi:MAG: phosphatidate cytidylyltransferase [Treponema sp.]|jgi:phosphatidate cytidylyltransferase|nr:phosphatidate cytidylyltransferase [Treponema sp.]
MKKIFQRLLIFFIAVPLVLALVVFFPQRNHLALNIVILVFIGLGSAEFSVILGVCSASRAKSPKTAGEELIYHPGRIRPNTGTTTWVIPVKRQVEAAILGILAPLTMTIVSGFSPIPGNLDISSLASSAAFILGGIWVLLSRVFSPEAELQDYTRHTASGFSVMVYPGLFLIWLIRMTTLTSSSLVILVFLLMVFGSDSVAWAAGMLFGKGNRGIVAASPNKSVAGFIGGIGASILVGAGAEFFIGDALVSRFFPSPFAGILLGFLSGCASSLGDLAESALKRSSGIKDSGTLIPGRGGVLDSIDSIALAAPVFYLSYRILFQ